MTSPDGLRLSVVICAYTERRRHDLQRAVTSIAEQTRGADQLILVIDHNDRLRHWAEAAHPAATVIPNTGRRGLSGARNCGVGAATGDVVAFLDDDAHAAPDWLAQLAAHYTDPRVAGVGGAATPVWPHHRPRWFPPEFDWVVGCSYVGLPTDTAPVRNPIGAGMSFRRAVFDRVGGFAEGLGRVGATPLGCEETEFGIRLQAILPDAVVLYEPRARVRHQVTGDRVSLRYFLARCHAEGLSKAAVADRAGADAALATERQYLRRTLPRALARDSRSPGTWPRAGAVLVGTGSTAVGYARGRLRVTAGRYDTPRQPIPSEVPVIPILLYHSVTDYPLANCQRWTVDTATFARHLTLIAGSGRVPLTVSEYVERMRHQTLPPRPILITFDDGFADNLAAAREVVAHGLTATCYVVTDWIGQAGMLHGADLQTLAGIGVEIGGHSHTHPRLDELRPDEAHREISSCNVRLAAVIGAPVSSFAYPHGNYDHGIRRLVQQAGFTSACGVRNMMSHRADDPFALARLTVTASTPDWRIRAWLDGAGRVAPAQELLRTRGSRLSRRTRVRLLGPRVPYRPIATDLPAPAVPAALGGVQS